MIQKYIIPLPPITKKNSQRILTNRRTGRPFIKPSAAYEKYETAAIWVSQPKTENADRRALLRCDAVLYADPPPRGFDKPDGSSARRACGGWDPCRRQQHSHRQRGRLPRAVRQGKPQNGNYYTGIGGVALCYPPARTAKTVYCTATAGAKNTKSTPSGARHGAKKENRSKPLTMQPHSAERKSAATASASATVNTERVDSMSYTTRPCENCGNLMIHVDSRRHICPKCNRELRNKENGIPKDTAHTVGETAERQKTPPPKRRVKPIAQCVREAEVLGISYGRYVQRGYDKITWKKILKLEVL